MNLSEVEKHIAELTGREGYFTFLQKNETDIAVFRRFSFILCDKFTMIRFRLLSEVTPKIESSFLNGLYIGDVRVDQNGKIIRGLSKQEMVLMRYLLDETMGAWVVEKEKADCFKIHYPGDFVETLIARAAQIVKGTPKVTVKNFEWHVSLPEISMQIDRFREHCRITASEALLMDIMGLEDEERANFSRLSCPCLLWAFGKGIDVSGAMRFHPETASQISDYIMLKLIGKYAEVKQDFLAGKPYKVSPEMKLPEIVGLPPVILFESDKVCTELPSSFNNGKSIRIKLPVC
ncbi:MAG: hypothetical protein ACYC4Q_10925, partial [Victivallaceae bacterium]